MHNFNLAAPTEHILPRGEDGKMTAGLFGMLAAIVISKPALAAGQP